MGILSKMAFNYDPIGKVRGIVKKWKPRKCSTEKDYESSLFRFLEKELPDIEVVKQYGIGRAKFDIAVGRKVFIEIKNRLDSTSKLQRLIGQLTIYKKEKVDNIVILICGKSDRNLLSQLNKEVKRHNNDALTFFDSDSVIVMQK